MKVRIKRALYSKKERRWSKKYGYGFIYVGRFMISLKIKGNDPEKTKVQK